MRGWIAHAAETSARYGAALVLLVLALVAWPLAATAQTPNPIWAKSVVGTNNVYVFGGAGDADGNYYVAGYMSGNLTVGSLPTLTKVSPGSDMVIIKFDANGNAVWAKNFGGAGAGATAAANDVAVDSAGNVYFTGTFSGNSIAIGGFSLTLGTSVKRLVAAKLNAADGSPAWASAFGDNGTTAVANSIALDGSGNVYLTGTFTGGTVTFNMPPLSLTGSGTNVVVAKLANNGTPTWAVNYGGTGTTGTALGIATDTSGNIYTFGAFSGGNITIGSLLTLAGASNYYVAKINSSGIPQWARSYGGTGVNVTSIFMGNALRVDGSGNSHFAGGFSGGSLSNQQGTPTILTRSGTTATDIVVAKVDTSGTLLWAKNFGGGNGTTSKAYGLAVDASGNVYPQSISDAASLNFGGVSLTKIGGTYSIASRLDSNGNVVWAQNYGGSANNASYTATAGAITGTSNLAFAGDFAHGPLNIGSFTVTGGSFDSLGVISLMQGYRLTAAVSGTGTVTTTPSGVSCGTTCSAIFNIGATVTLTASGGTFTGWSGACAGTNATTTVTMSEARSCVASFTTPMTPPAPPPSFVSTTSPPPSVVSANTSGSGQGTVSLASSFTNPSSLTFTASQVSGAALPTWLTFNPSTVSFNYNVPLPADLPIQPSAADVAPRAGRSIVNTVYPLAVLVQTVPVALTASGAGQSYTVTVNMDFYAPRAPVAITALSYSAGGASGNGASARPSLSWDGGQVVFETLATNINPASGSYSSIARYQGLSGQRDLLSQTAIPGGGVANGADGNSNSPAVAASGSHVAFSSAAPGMALAPNNRLRQVYRTSLGWPRVALNEAATPAAVMMSSTAAGVAADAAADLPAVSERGEFVAFESAAGNLGTNPNRLSQIWRKEAATGAIVLVSSTVNGTAGDGDSRNVSLSWDGRFAVFDSSSTNFTFGAPSGRHVYLKDIATGQIYRLSGTAGASSPKIDARALSVVYVSASGTKSQIMRYDVISGATTVVSVNPSGVGGNGDSLQPALSADGRFVAFRSTSSDLAAGYTDNGQAQIWVRDVMRGVTGLVSQTEAGAPGNGASSDPALSGDGSQVGFASQARNLVNGTPLPGQIHLAGNPLVLPGRTAYWYTTDGGNLTWSIERWGDKALIAGLAYNANGGTAVWAAGSCQFSGLTCQGSVSQWRGQGQASTPVGPVTLTFAADGRTATAALGGAAARNLAIYPVGGPRTTGFAGLPQDGYWGVSGNGPGISSLFIDTDTQVTVSGASAQVTHVTLFGYDAQGNAQWYAAEGALGTDQTFSGTLYLYAGGSSWTGAAGSNAPSATALGTLRLTFTTTDRATVQLPDGRTAAIARWRF